MLVIITVWPAVLYARICIKIILSVTEVVYLSNFPATRFYLNLNHPAANDMKLRYKTLVYTTFEN